MKPLFTHEQLRKRFHPQYDHDCQRIRDEFLRRFPATRYVEIVVDADNSSQRDTQRARGLIEGIKIAERQFGTRRYIGGVRAAESGMRTLSLRSRGIVGDQTCQPIGWWSDADVFGWLAFHDLPVHPAYAMTGGGRYPRERIRVSIIGGAKGTGGNRRAWEQEYYADVLRRLPTS